LSCVVFLHPKAGRSLRKLPESTRKRVLEALKELENSPEKGDQLKPSQFWRLRVGDYRAIYEIERGQGKIIVLYIGYRKHVYDDFSRLL
jgi:mRNA interferase RelE/StbE